jgi:hypothetical protein
MSLPLTGDDKLPLTAEPLDPAGPFTIVNALRPLPPGGTLRLLLAFTPTATERAWEILTLRSAKSRLRLALGGAGVAPRLQLLPRAHGAPCQEGGGGAHAPQSPGGARSTAAPVTPGGGAAAAPGTVAATGAVAVAVGPLVAAAKLDLGDVLAADARETRIGVHNPSPFPVAFTTRFVGWPAPCHNDCSVGRAALAPGARAPSGCFFTRPGGATLEPGATIDVAVVFAPGGPAPAAAATAAFAAAAVITGSRGTRNGGAGTGASGGAAAVAGLPQAIAAWAEPYIRDTLEVVVARSVERLLLPVEGRVWGEGVFLSGPDYPHPSCVTGALTGLGSCASDTTAGLRPAAPPVQRLVLTLPGPVAPGGASTATLLAGSVRSSGGGGAVGEAVLEDLAPADKAAGWSIVGPLKQVLLPGEVRPFVVRFAPPAPPQAAAAVGPPGGGTAGSGATAVGGGVPTVAGGGMCGSSTPAGGGDPSVAALLGLPEGAECMLRVMLRGGAPFAGSAVSRGEISSGDGSRRLEVRCTCTLLAAPAAGGGV